MDDYTHNIAANIHKPESESNILAILLPGLLMSKDYKNFTELGEFLKSKGITSVRFDPTGTWESEADITNYSITQYLADIDYVLNFINQDNQYYKIILVGHSLGGMVGHLFASKFEEIDAVVAIFSPGKFGISEFTSSVLPQWKSEGKLSLKRKNPFDLGVELNIDLPYEFVEDADDYDAFDAVSSANYKKLFIGSNLDATVKFEQVKDFFERAKEPKQLLEVNSAIHIYWKNAQALTEINEVIADFILKL